MKQCCHVPEIRSKKRKFFKSEQIGVPADKDPENDIIGIANSFIQSNENRFRLFVRFI